MKALLLAGGYATRLWPLTEGIAKPLLIVGSKPLLSHVVDGIPDEIEIIVTTNEDFTPDFQSWAKEFHPNRNITILKEPSSRDKQLGALGSLSYAIKKFGEDDYLISAGDNIYPFPIPDFINSYKKNIIVAAYNIGNLELAKKFGVVTIDKNTHRAIDFQEKPSQPKSTFVSTALYILPKDKLYVLHDAAKESSENIGSFLERAIKENVPVDVYQFKGDWYDIGSFETYVEVHKKFSKSTDNQSESNKLIGSVYIDPKADVQDSIIQNSIILAGSKLKNVNLNQVIVGRNCQLENIDLEYKSIRDKTRLIGG